MSDARPGQMLRGDIQQVGTHLLCGSLDGEARERGGAAGARGAVVGREAGVGADAADAFRLQAQHLRRDLGERGALALAHLRGAHEHDRLAVRLQPHDGARNRVGAGRQEAHRQAPTRVRRLGVMPAERRGDLLDIPDQVRIQGLAAGAYLLAGPQQVAAADLQCIDTRPPSDLVDLHLADPLDVRGAKGPVRARRCGIGVDAQGVHPDRGPAIGSRGGIAAGRRDAGAVVGVGAGVEGDDDVACQQRAGSCPPPCACGSERHGVGW